jgi:hypothetical protein
VGGGMSPTCFTESPEQPILLSVDQKKELLRQRIAKLQQEKLLKMKCKLSN